MVRQKCCIRFACRRRWRAVPAAAALCDRPHAAEALAGRRL